MDKEKRVQMTVNGYELNISMAAFDGCHKIYIPVEGQEDLFILSLTNNGWDWPKDFYQIENAETLMDIYIDSCPLRFIQQIDCSGAVNDYIEIIPQCEFGNEKGFLDVKLVRAAFGL